MENSPAGTAVARPLSPRVVAGLTFVVAALNLASVLSPRIFHRLEFVSDVLPGVDVAAPGVSVAIGLLLLGLAQGLARGKHRAWRIAVALLAVQVPLQIVQAHRLPAVASLALLTLLVVTRREYVGRPDPSTRRRALVVGAALLGASLAIGWIAVSLLDHHLRTGLSAGARMGATLQGLVGLPSAVTSGDNRAPDVVYYLLLSLGVLTVAVTGYLALRSTPTAVLHSAEDEVALRGLLARHGSQDSLGYFSTRDDRALAWSPNRAACVSYRVVSGAALAAGDPIGPRSQWPQAMSAFLEDARRHAWVPAVVAASQTGAEAWERHGGLTALEFGDEAVLDADTFSLLGREMRNVRQAAARATRAGYVVRVERLGQLDHERAELLRDRAELWRADTVERGFSMGLGRLDPVRDPDAVVVTADLDGTPGALLVFVPWGSGGLSLDLMRRSPSAESGVNELMISTLLQGAHDWGIERVSLNFAVFRDAIERAERIGAGPATRAWGRTLRTISRWSQADSLYRFNAKFRPSWAPRYLVYASASGLPRVAVAYLDAESLVRLPRLTRLTRPAGLAPVVPTRDADLVEPAPPAGEPAGVEPGPDEALTGPLRGPE